MVRRSTSDRPTWLEVRDTWQETRADLGEVFVKLNWARPQIPKFSVTTKDGETFEVNPVATLKNFHALQIELPTTWKKSSLRTVQREVSKHYPDNVLIARDSSVVQIEWPRRKPDGDLKYDTFTTSLEHPHQLTCQKLAGASFEISELSKATLEDVRSRVYGLSSEIVTKRFYEKFRDEHENLAVAVSSTEELSNEERHSYSSLLLNRLMFIYFLQKKEFLSGDPQLLNKVLAKCIETDTDFYRDALLPLFFEGFNGQRSRFESERLNDWWGAIPYINGGIFAPHGLEARKELGVPNSVFSRVFEFFEMFEWHLDSRPIGTKNEINPEVLGFIFEQYINYTADGKKESGAYYTPEDVTGFIISQTLIPRVLDEFVKIWPDCLELVKQKPLDYIHRSLLHGRVEENTTGWVTAPDDLEKIWQEDPAFWGTLDAAETIPEVCLPGETWVETFHRRERVERLIQDLRKGIVGVNDVITHNLNGARLVSDVIAGAESPTDMVTAWKRLSELSVIDPTCGSGAFLFAALTSLESVYEDLLDALGENAKLVGEQFARGNAKYQIRKHVAMRNLYGTDIMADAIETAKLRIFLALVAVLERTSEIEPLPDLDFNLKTGNLVIGLYDMADATRINPEGTFADVYDLTEIEALTSLFQDQFRGLKHAELNEIESVPHVKAELVSTQSKLRELTNAKYLEIAGIDVREKDAWISNTKPLHWFAEFPEIIERGGFDVVIGNPPYIKKSSLDSVTKIQIEGFATAAAPDFYATCYERSLQIKHADGRHSLVVMLNLACGDRFESLRDVVTKAGVSEWWATFGKRPDSLFRGVQVRNTILTVGPGTEVFSSRHHVIPREQRDWFFQQIQYFNSSRFEGKKPLRAGLAMNIADAIAKAPKIDIDPNGSKIFFRGRAQYWFPVLPSKLPEVDEDFEIVNVDDSLLGSFPINANEQRSTIIAALGGMLGFLWWNSTSDDFNVLTDHADAIRRLVGTVEGDDELHTLANRVLADSMNNVFGTKNAGKIQMNIRWKSVGTSSINFDKKLLEVLGLETEWRPLNIWYRQAMRASRNNSNSVEIDRETIQKILRAARKNSTIGHSEIELA
jgi:hypothetical protein